MAITAPTPSPEPTMEKPFNKPMLNVNAPVAWQKSVLATLDTGMSPINTSALRSPLRAFNINMMSDLEIGSPIDSSEVEIKSPIRNFSINLAGDDGEPGSPITKDILASPGGLKARSITAGPAMSLNAAMSAVEENFLISETEKLLLSPVSPEVAKSDAEIAHRIMDCFEKFGKHIIPEDSEDHTWLGRKMFHPRVEQYVNDGVPIKMIMPAFPWKSINRVDKVIGTLPDLGEMLALARLNALTEAIGKVYKHGAEVHIATDGLVFNDIVGISDDETWEYGSRLMEMAEEKGYKGIKLIRVMDFLGISDNLNKKMSKDEYMMTVDQARKELESQFGNALEEVRKMIDTDPDTLLTYRGFIRFLEVDLRNSPVAAHATSGHKYRKVVKEVAMKMMMRAESFTKIILATCPDYVRLSIHPSSGAVKLSMPLLEEKHNPDGFPRTPWHSCIAVSLDGGYQSLHARDVRHTHDLVHRNGQPWCFREKSELFDLGENVEIEHLYPTGIEVRPKDGSQIADLGEDAKEKLRKLAKLQPVKAVGFADAKEFSG